MYTPHTWVADETITAEKLNHIENGVADTIRIDVGQEFSESEFNMLKTAILDGKNVTCVFHEDGFLYTSTTCGVVNNSIFFQTYNVQYAENTTLYVYNVFLSASGWSEETITQHDLPR